MAQDDYDSAQALGRQLRNAGSDGIVFMSVRHQGGQNIAAFWPDVVGIPVQANHFKYNWTGERIDRIFDYGKELWFEVR